MAKTKTKSKLKSTTKTKTKKRKQIKKKPPNALYRCLKKVFLGLFVVLTFLFLTYLGYLDDNVRRQFEGRRWALPAKVFAI